MLIRIKRICFFAARVCAGTNLDLHSAITTGISVLSGPSHGGAAENVMKMVKEVDLPSLKCQRLCKESSKITQIVIFVDSI